MAATTTKGIPYPQSTDNNNVPADMQALAEYIDSRIHSAGDIKVSIRTTAETGWAKIDGSTITDAQSLYPDLWAVAPAAWKSGSNIVLPQWCGGSEGAVLRGAATDMTLGATTGANTLTLTTAQLPSHSHGAGTLSAVSGGAHTHTINHDHPSSQAYVVAENNASTYLAKDVSGYGTLIVGDDGIGFDVPYANITSASTSKYEVNVNLPNFTGTSGSSGSHTHTISGSTDTEGSGNAIDMKSKSAGVNFFIKL